MHTCSNRVFGCTNRVYNSQTFTHPSVNAQIYHNNYIVPIFVLIIVSVVVKLTLGQNALVFC